MLPINQVIITGKLAGEPKQINSNGTQLYLFTMASVGPTGRFVFPPILAAKLPDFVAYKPDAKMDDQPTLTVIGWVRTVNADVDLVDEVLRLARRAKVPGKIMQRLQAVLGKLDPPRTVPRVVVDIFAEQILPGGEWI
jgi:hypothetical protein